MSVKHDINFKLLHQTKNRARYFCDILNDDVNSKNLENDLLSIRGVSSVRINEKSKSIIFEFQDTPLECIESFLMSLDRFKYEVCDTFLSNNISCIAI